MECYFSLAMAGLWIFLFLVNYSNLRSDLVLIEGTASEFYQRPGDFIVIMFVIQVAVYGNYQSASLVFSGALFNFTRFFSVSLLVLSGFLAMLISQFIGSNKAFISLGGILMGVVFVEILLFYRYVLRHLRNGPLSLYSFIIGRAARYTYLTAFFSIVLVSVLIFLTVWIFDLELNKLRVLGLEPGG